MAEDSLNGALLESARACGKSSHWLWAVDDNPADLDLAEQREPVDVGETKGAPHLDLLSNVGLSERGADVGDLRLDALLAQRAATGRAAIDRGGRGGSDLGAGTARAGDRARCRVPDHHGAHREIGGADPALIATAQTQLFWWAWRADENGIGRDWTRLDLNQRMVERETRCGSAEW